MQWFKKDNDRIIIVGMIAVISMLKSSHVMANAMQGFPEPFYPRYSSYLSDFIFLSIFFVFSGVILVWGWYHMKLRRMSIILSVVVLLAAIAVFGNSIYEKRKQDNYHGEIISLAKNMVTSQEDYYMQYNTYTNDLDKFEWLNKTVGIDIVLKGDETSWECEIRHTGYHFALHASSMHYNWIPLTDSAWKEKNEWSLDK